MASDRIMQRTLNQASQHTLEPTRIVASQNGFYKVVFKVLDNPMGPSNVLEWVPKQAVSDHLVSTWRAQRAERMAFRQHRKSQTSVVRDARADDVEFEPMEASHAASSHVVSPLSSSASQHPQAPTLAATSSMPDSHETPTEPFNVGASTSSHVSHDMSVPHSSGAAVTDAVRQHGKDMGASHHPSTSEPLSVDGNAAASMHLHAICDHPAEPVNHNAPTLEITETSRHVLEDAQFEPMPPTPPEQRTRQEVVDSSANQSDHTSESLLAQKPGLPLTQSRSGRRIQPPPTETLSKDEQIAALQKKLEMQLEEITLLRGLYEEASQSASRDAAALKEANTTLEALKVQLKDGIETQRQLCSVEIAHRISESEKAQKQLAMVQWQLNEGQVELRRKADLWEKHVKQLEIEEKERLKREQAAELQNDMMQELAELAVEAQEFTPPTPLPDNSAHDKSYVADAISTTSTQNQMEAGQDVIQQRPAEAPVHANHETSTATRPAVRQRKTPVSAAGESLAPFSQPGQEITSPSPASIPQTRAEADTHLQPSPATPPRDVSQESLELSISVLADSEADTPVGNPNMAHTTPSHSHSMNTPVPESTNAPLQESSPTHSPPSHSEAPKPRWKRRRYSRMSSVSL